MTHCSTGSSQQPGYEISPHQGYEISPHQGYEISPHQGYEISPHQGYEISPQSGEETNPEHMNERHAVPAEEASIQAPFDNHINATNYKASHSGSSEGNIEATAKQTESAEIPGWQKTILDTYSYQSIEEYYHAKFKELCIAIKGPSKKTGIPLNDMGMATLFRIVHELILKVVRETGIYRVFDGTSFREDMDLVSEICKCFIIALCSYAEEADVSGAVTLVPKGKGCKMFTEYAASFHSRAKRKSLLTDAATIFKTPIEQFDSKPHLFNCANGTYNLKTMEFGRHDPHDYLTMISRVQYDANANFSRWDKFINEIMENQTDKISYLQKVMGYSLSGDRSQRCFLVLYGPRSSNGKSTLVGSIEYLLGDYAKTAQPQTIAKRNTNGASPSPDLARLRGIRLVNMPEPSKNFEIDAALVKQLTGGDPIATRFVRGNTFQFVPEFFIIISTNYMLQISDQSVIESKRMKVIQFNKSFVGAQDTDLKQTFREPEAMSAIFNWLLEGYRQYKAEEHLETTNKLQEELMAFGLEATGQLNEFLSSNLEKKEKAKTKVSEIHKRHCEWAAESGLKQLSKHAFLPALKDKYPSEVRRDSALGNVLHGYALKPLDESLYE